MKNNKPSLSQKKAIREIAKVAHYGAGWLDSSNAHEAYTIGGVEAVAHVCACMVTQTITNDSTDTGEMRDLLDLLAPYQSADSFEVKLTNWLFPKDTKP